jgi:hypothetical protein
MSAKENPYDASIWRTYGTPAPPETITQDPWDGDNHYLKRLASLKPGERPQGWDLFMYAHAVHFSEIQTPLLRYLLPFCFVAWREELVGAASEYGGFVEEFYPALVDRKIFDEELTPRQSNAATEFMRQTIVEEIDSQRGLAFRGHLARPYRWIGALTTYGILRPDIGLLWEQWWSLGTTGRSVAAIQYISCLMYNEGENPVFAGWTQDEGGGPPCLWELEGHLYTHSWLESNVRYLQETLVPERVKRVLVDAVGSLAGEPEYELGVRVREDVSLLDDVVRIRCAELPTLLARIHRWQLGEELEWSK